MWPLRGHGSEHSDSLSTVMVRFMVRRGKAMWKLDRDERKKAGMEWGEKLSAKHRGMLVELGRS